MKMPTVQATIFSRADLWVLRGTYPFFCEICIISPKFSIKYVVSIQLAPVIQTFDSAIQRVSHYLADKNQGDLSSGYGVLLNNWGLV